MFEWIDDCCVDLAGKKDEEGLEYQLKSIKEDLKALKSGRETT